MDIRQIIDVPRMAEVPRGSTWSGDIDGLANSDWDANWIFTESGFGHLPQRNYARQHEGFSSASSSPEPQATALGDATARKGREGFDDIPCPSITLPRPRLEFDFRIDIAFDSPPLVGTTDVGRVLGGSWTATFGTGTVVANGHGLSQEGVDASFKLRTNDEPPAILEFLGRGTPLAKDGSCRMVINITSEDLKYAKVVNVGMWIGTGMWKDRQFVIDAYRVG
ncbi:hypothetical protein F5X68DRAFT_211040 [Plectosphaerella plurivora]|uniref:Uncharacterized protein n=1 Tax=Plectosphaerella plurivora TaxID=936078 RepID=A0A9P8V9V0_9PEZI|nr:hypothetical protein F5X68DRAFT_211040 [Plectosphaerella plurivora]